MNSHPESSGHWTHLLVEVHNVQWIAHLLLEHDIICLVVHHVVYRYLTLSSALLRSHWHVVRLVHCVLVALARFRFACVLRFLVGVLHYFVHLDLVSY